MRKKIQDTLTKLRIVTCLKVTTSKPWRSASWSRRRGGAPQLFAATLRVSSLTRAFPSIIFATSPSFCLDGVCVRIAKKRLDDVTVFRVGRKACRRTIRRVSMGVAKIPRTDFFHCRYYSSGGDDEITLRENRRASAPALNSVQF